MEIPNLSTEEGLNYLNDHLSKFSYLHGSPIPTANDALTFKAILKAGIQPNRQTYPHFERWFRNIKSFNLEERNHFPQHENGSLCNISGFSDVIEVSPFVPKLRSF